MEEKMKNRSNQAHLFILRIWSAEGGEGALQWRVRLQDIQSGEVSFFKDWRDMIAGLEESLREGNEASMSVSAVAK